MAEGKKSVLLYADIIHTVEQLDDKTAGELFKHYLRYINDWNPETDNVLVKIAFEPIKQSLKRDLAKWETKQQEKSTNGRLGNLKRYNLDLYEQVIEGVITIEEAENIAKSRKASLSDNTNSEATNEVAKVAVSVNVNDSVSVNVNDIKKEAKALSSQKSDVETPNFEGIQKYWNDRALLHGLPELKIMNKRRKDRIRVIYRDHSKDKLREAMDRCFESDFCLGKKTDFKADFDFVLQEKSFVKLIEGSYGDNKPNNPQQQITTLTIKEKAPNSHI